MIPRWSHPLAAALLLALAAPAGGAALLAQGPQASDTTMKKSSAREGLPLEPARKFGYTAREGSWISLDVSPDGQTIVFDLLGDLYTLPITGGKATRLSHGMGFDAQPRFSPDGKRVVFTSDRDGGDNVWVLSLDLRDTLQVTKGKTTAYQSPEWTPDGKYIVVTRASGGPGKLWLYHVEGGSGTGLIREPQTLRTTGAAFGDDSRYIWFAQRTGNWQYNSRMSEYQLAVYDRETGRSAVKSFRYGGAFRPTLSPDGKWLVYGTRHVAETGLRLRNLETGEERWLAYPVQRDEQESMATRDALPGMAFTPDSKDLVVSYGGKIWRVPVDGSAPKEVPFEVEVDLDLGPQLDFEYPIVDSATFVIRQIRDAVPSPDGRRLAFTALNRLYVMDFPDGTPRRLTDAGATNEHMPTWSPDGQWIAYATWSFADGGHLYRVRADGRGRPQRLTTLSALYQQPAWSPDGQRVVAIRGPAQAFYDAGDNFVPGAATDLVWVPAAGGAATVIAPVTFTAPHFTRDPGRIYGYSGADGLVSIRWDGSDRQQHIKVTGATMPGATNPINAGLIRMAPAGDQALAQVVNDLYVVTVPQVGGTVPTISVANPENAAFPVRRLTDIGGQFPAWSADGRKVHWSIGNAHLVYDLDAARAHDDSVKAADRALKAAAPDTAAKDTAAKKDAADKAAKKEEKGYQPRETRIAMRAPRDIPQGVAVLRGARVVTMRGTEVLEDAEIVVRNNRIEAVGRRGSVSVPEGARVIDVAGKTIVPGFVDTHAHMWPAWGIHKDQVPAYAANLAYGVTTTRDPQTATTDVITYGDLVATGRILGPRVYSTGPGVFGAEQVKSRDHALKVLRRYSDYYDTKTIKMYMAGNREQRQWIVDAARELKLMPTTEGGLDFKMNLTMALDGYAGMEHTIPAFPHYGDVVRLVAESRMVYTPTILVAYGGPWAENYFYATENVMGDAKLRAFTPFEELQSKALRRPGPGPGTSGWFHPDVHVFRQIGKTVKDVVEAGGRVGVGSHGQLQGLGYHWELWAMQSGGLGEHDALRVATLMGAEALGLDKDVGSIEPGKLADLVILERNPLEDIRNTNTVRMVMMNGRLYDGDTLDELWPRQQKNGPFHWQNDEARPRPAAGIR